MPKEELFTPEVSEFPPRDRVVGGGGHHCWLLVIHPCACIDLEIATHKDGAISLWGSAGHLWVLSWTSAGPCFSRTLLGMPCRNVYSVQLPLAFCLPKNAREGI